VLATAVVGLLGFRFIDNAAHAGGLLAGLLYGVIVFPKSLQVGRPRATWMDLAGGAAAVVVLCGSAGLAAWLSVF
jgi:membrane associated rhomboid family serine protease